MAYVPSSLSSQNAGTEKKNLEISGGGAGSTPAAANGIPNSSPAAPSNSSGGFTSIRSYLDTNAGGAQKLGDQVSGLIQKDAGEARSAISSGQNAFDTQVQQNTTNYDQADVNSTLNSGAPSSYTTRQLSGEYKGPKTLNDVGARQAIDKEVNEATNAATLAKDQGGRIELLRQVAGRPTTAGVSRLNETLLHGNAAAQGKVNTAAEDAAKIGNEVSAVESAAAQKAAQAAQINAATKNKVTQDIDAYLSLQDQAIQDRFANLSAAERQRQTDSQNYLDRVLNYGATPVKLTDRDIPRASALAYHGNGEGADATTQVVGPAMSVQAPSLVTGYESLGLTPEQATRLQQAIADNRTANGSSVNLNRFYTPADLNIALSRANAVSAPDATRLTALANLVGRQGYQSAATNVNNRFDVENAIAALNTSRDAAKQLSATKAAEEAAKVAAATPPTVINNTTVVKKDPVSSIVGAVLSPVTAVTKAIFGGCVIATALVERGDWNVSQHHEIVDWCERTLHGSVIGESLRRGYKIIGSKIAVPGIRKRNKVGEYFKYVFSSVADFGAKREQTIGAKVTAVSWLGVCVVLGAFITDKYAEKTWKSLYKDRK